MKPARLSAALLCISLVFAGPLALARDLRPSPQMQKDFDQFIGQFRAALKTNSGEAVADLTRFPFQGDAAQDRAHFLKKTYGQLFTGKVRTCLAKAKATFDRSPAGEESYTMFCGEQLFQFAKTPQGFRFSDTGAND